MVEIGRTPEVEGATRISPAPDHARVEIEFEQQSTTRISPPPDHTGAEIAFEQQSTTRISPPPEVKKPLVPKPPAVAAAPLDMSGPLGTLKLTTTPAAKVSIAGNALGETPLTTLLINVVEGRETVVRDVED